MHYGKINTTDIANGPGVRVSLFVSGCRNHCKGCFNQETWDFNYGNVFGHKELDELLESLDKDYISGLTILGGDPFEPENIRAVYIISLAVKATFPDKNVWVYTGYTFEYLKDVYPQYLMQHIDVLVDGRYIEEQRDITLRFRGSKNQRLIDIQASLKEDRVVLIED